MPKTMRRLIKGDKFGRQTITKTTVTSTLKANAVSGGSGLRRQ